LSLITKTDLLPHVDFDLDRARAYAQQVHPGIRQIALSCRSGEGLDEWHAWIAGRRTLAAAALSHAEAHP
jgi:hydrogenase nickel incorporation protein HypB